MQRRPNPLAFVFKRLNSWPRYLSYSSRFCFKFIQNGIIFEGAEVLRQVRSVRRAKFLLPFYQMFFSTPVLFLFGPASESQCSNSWCGKSFAA